MKRAKAVPFVASLFYEMDAERLFDLLVSAGLDVSRLWMLAAENAAQLAQQRKKKS